MDDTNKDTTSGNPMETTLDSFASEEDDVLKEAEAFLSNIGKEAAPEAEEDDFDLDGFAIDSDDDDEAVPSLNDKEEETPVVTKNSKSENDNKSNGTPSIVTSFHPLSDEMLNAPSNAGTATTVATTPTTTSTTTTTASSAPPSSLQIQEKAYSFASQLSSFAHRAATQIDKMSDKVAQAAQANAMEPSTTQNALAKTSTTPTTPHLELDNDQKAKLIAEHVGDLLPGERVIMFLSNLLHVSDSSLKTFSFTSGMWCCAMTYYRILLFHTSYEVLLQVPLASIDKVEKSVYTTPGTKPTTLMGLVVYGKDNGRQLRFTTPSYGDTLRAHEALLTYAFPGRRNLGYLFAFESKRSAVMASIVTDPQTGQKKVTLPPTRARFVPLKEFTRQGILDNDNNSWVVWTNINANYQLCSSYPSVLVGPSCLSDDPNSTETARIIRQCAAFRSEQRLPVLTWACGVGGGGSLWRASQPKVGLQGNRSAADEVFLRKIAETATTANATLMSLGKHKRYSAAEIAHLVGSHSLEWTTPDASLKILDLRPKSSAMANRTGGYGYENVNYYPCASISFCNIGNIHAVRDAYQKVSALCLNKDSSDTNWTSSVEDTRWMTQVRLLLRAGWITAFWIHVHNLPVLLHCSHGWDRTSQVAALAQLLLDPYYRTMEGFVTLVEKDFLSFGHPFHTRCAHGSGSGLSTSDRVASASSNSNSEGQVSPIFIQFLDCVVQMVTVAPEQFEFNTRFLLLISEHVYSCRFGTMLCDTERERQVVAGIRQRTHCLWDYLHERKEELMSVFYKQSTDIMWITLPTLLRNVSLWTDRHAMHGPKETVRAAPRQETETRYAHDQESNLVTREDYYTMEIAKARAQATKWKQMAQANMEKLDLPESDAEEENENSNEKEEQNIHDGNDKAQASDQVKSTSD